MTYDSTQAKPALIRLRQVMARTGMSRSTIYAYVKNGRFPTPISISERCVAWIEADIDRWISDRITLGRRAYTKDAMDTFARANYQIQTWDVKRIQVLASENQVGIKSEIGTFPMIYTTFWDEIGNS